VVQIDIGGHGAHLLVLVCGGAAATASTPTPSHVREFARAVGQVPAPWHRVRSVIIWAIFYCLQSSPECVAISWPGQYYGSRLDCEGALQQFNPLQPLQGGHLPLKWNDSSEIKKEWFQCMGKHVEVWHE
jgi:hypothetical protein